MSKYDSMSFKELVQETINHSCNDLLLPPDDWLDMMRRAVIREANGIAFHIENHETARNEYGAWTEKRVNGHVEPRGSSLQMIPPGDYVLISKETP